MPQRRAGTVKARPIRGKDESFTARITPETREALRRSADSAGHSMSSELEILLRSALRARAAAANQIDTLFELGWKAARRAIEDADGVGPADSAEVHAAIRDIIAGMLKRLPAPSADARLESDPKAPEPQKRKSLNPMSRRPRDIDVGDADGSEDRDRQ